MKPVAITPDYRLIQLEDLVIKGTTSHYGGVATAAELLDIARDTAHLTAVQMGLVVGEDPEAIRVELQGLLPILLDRLQRAGLMNEYEMRH
jgi:hypothetical protein